MLIKPDLKDEEIIACLRDAYGLDIATVSFLPLGADFNTAVYRVITTDLSGIWPNKDQSGCDGLLSF